MGLSGLRGDCGGEEGPLAIAYNVPDAVWAFTVTPTDFAAPWDLSPLGVTLVTVYEAPYVKAPAPYARGVSRSVCELPLTEEVELVPGDAGESGGREPEYIALKRTRNEGPLFGSI